MPGPGTLAIPNVFNPTVGDQPFANLDANFVAVQDYVNVRTPSTGLIANRPPPGNAGAIYLATDVALGTLYVDTGAAWLAVAVAPSSDPTVTYVLHEDFQGPLDTLVNGAAAFYRLQTGIYSIAASNVAAGAGFGGDFNARGIFILNGDGANVPGIIGPYSDLVGGALKLPVKASDSPTLTFRCGNVTLNNTKRVGASATTLGAVGEPANGIYIRWIAAGNIFAVCRTGGVETTLDLGIAPGASVMRAFKFAITAATVAIFVDGVQKGVIAANIPAVGLAIGAGVSTNVATDSLLLDYINVTFAR